MAVFKVITEVCDQNYKKKYHDTYALRDVISYIFDARKTTGRFIGGYGVNVNDAAAQMMQVAYEYGKTDGIWLRHMILSFHPNEHVSPDGAMVIAAQLAEYYRWQYQIVYAVHVDTDCVNIHLVMNVVSYETGKKYYGKKKDYYQFIEHIKQVLYPFGIHLRVVSDREERAGEGRAQAREAANYSSGL